MGDEGGGIKRPVPQRLVYRATGVLQTFLGRPPGPEVRRTKPPHPHVHAAQVPVPKGYRQGLDVVVHVARIPAGVLETQDVPHAAGVTEALAAEDLPLKTSGDRRAWHRPLNSDRPLCVRQ